MTTFYDLRLYTVGPFQKTISGLYTEDELYNISYYKFSDIITLPDLNLNLIRLAF